MIKPIHIFLLTLVASVVVYKFNDSFALLNELFGTGTIISLFLFERRKQFNKIDNVAIYGLLSLNLVNISAMFIGMIHDHYMLAFTIVASSFSSIIFYLKINERFDK